MLQQRSSGFNISATESLKIIGQNLETIDQLRDSMQVHPDLSKVELSQLDAFDFNSRRLIIGQWIDVKDTIHQWVGFIDP